MIERRILSSLRYEAATGAVYRTASGKNSRVGTRADKVKADGYAYVHVAGKRVSAHRLAYLFMMGHWPDAEIDHINLLRSDNRWVNLRAATKTQNRYNQKARVDNTTGAKGVSYRKDRGTFRATINNAHIGTFRTVTEAARAYEKAASLLHGPFCRVR